MADALPPIVELVARATARTAVDNETYFCNVDSVAGYGDFGYSLGRRFEKALDEFDALNRAAVGGAAGGAPISGSYPPYGVARPQLAAREITVGRRYVGEYGASLEMAGDSSILVRLDDEIDVLLDAPAESAMRVA